MDQQIFCVYLTTYRGNKLPPFYIGSSSIDKINNGYHGSVSSKQYKHIWKNELKMNPHLFYTRIISRFNTQKEAIARELFIHKHFSVVRNKLYTNKSEARKNGFFGVSLCGKDNPAYGKPRTGNHPKGMLGKKHSKEARAKMSEKRLGKPGKSHSEETKLRMRDAKLGTQLSPEHKKNLSISRKGKPKSEAHKRSISEAHKGKPKSEEHKENSRIALELVRIERKLGIREPIKPRSENSRKNISEKHKNMPDLTCPHCNKTGGHSGMLSWHFDNCKHKSKELIQITCGE